MLVRSPETSWVFGCLLVLCCVACRDGTVSFAPGLEAAGGGDDGDVDDDATGGTANRDGTAGTAKAGRGSGGAPASGGRAPNGGDDTSGSGPTGGVAPTGGSTLVGCDEPSGAAPAMKWVNATGNLAGMESECGNLGLVSAQPCSARVIAGVAKKGLWETLDGGKSWQALGTGKGSAEITNRISSIVYDPTDPRTFWESGIYNGGCVYRTRDDGKTFEQLGDISHCDSVSVDLTDPTRQTLLAGTHESNVPPRLSTDGGKSWSDVGPGLPGGFCNSTLVLDAKTFLVGCDSGSIMRSTDAGGSWQIATGSTGGTYQPLRARDGNIYWPGSAGGVSRSRDDGVSFEPVADAAVSPGIMAPAQFAELPDGRIVINGHTHLLASSDQGKTWQAIGEALPLQGGGYDGIHGLTYSAGTKTFFVWHWDCQDKVPEDAILSMGFDWETQ